MFRKIAAVLLLILGIASAAYGYHVYTHPVSLGSCAEVQNGELKQENEGQLVFTKGELSFSKGAYDPFFGIQTDSLILIRTVEMYQRMEKDISTGEVTEGSLTTFTNKVWVRKPTTGEKKVPKTPGNPVEELTDYETPLGVDVMINHVGDCFD